VAELEEITVRQDGQPGGLSFGLHPIVAELVEIGDVDALADVLERDERLTRSVSFHRDFKRSRWVAGVHEPAYAALRRILGHGLGGDWWTPEGRRAAS
jgi:hypothetical protein